jgi:alpha-glucosidase
VWRRWRSVVDAYAATHPGRQPYLVAEAYSPRRPELLLEYLRPDEFQQAFSFDLLLSPWHAPSMRQAIDDSVGVVARSGAALTWTLNNHDAQRDATRYGRADATDPASWTGNNLVNSDAPVDLLVGQRRARAAALVVLALPGAAYLYQGEELGLPEVLDIPADRREDPLFFRTGGAEIGRDGCRVPMPWTRDPATNYGFSGVAGARAWLPQPSGWDRWSVAAQEDDPDSTLQLHRRAVAVRRRWPGLRGEAFAWVDVPGDVLAFRRDEVLVVLNVGGTPVALPADVVEGYRVCVSSVPGHDDAGIVPGDAAVWLTPRS